MTNSDSGHLSVLFASNGTAARGFMCTIELPGAETTLVALDDDIADLGYGARHFDLLVCDGDAGWKEALALARRVRSIAHDGWAFPPILVLASDLPIQRVVEARNAGVQKALRTPLSAAALAAEIADLVDHPRPFVRNVANYGSHWMAAAGPAAGLAGQSGHKVATA